MSLSWSWARLEALPSLDIYALFQARQAVFVLEQTCLYPDIDALDPCSWHLLGKDGDELVAYLRVVPPGLRYPEPSIGRVLTVAGARRRGFGRLLMLEGIQRTIEVYPKAGVRLSGQTYLIHFYSSLGFVPVGDPYEEDGIPHQEMERQP